MLPLARTCSQGLRKWREERQRRFYRILRDLEESYLEETGNHFSSPQELASKPDMTEVKSLRVTLPGPLPVEDQEDIPHALNMLFALPLNELVLHYAASESRPANNKGAVDAFSAMYGLLYGEEIWSDHVTIIWDCRDDKQDAILRRYTFELKNSRKSAIRRAEQAPGATQKTIWPVIKCAVGANMEVGLVIVSRGSNNSVAREGLFQLATFFCDLGDPFTADPADLQWGLKTFEIEMVYRAGDNG